MIIELSKETPRIKHTMSFSQAIEERKKMEMK